MRLWGTLVCFFYVLHLTVVHTQDDTDPGQETSDDEGGMGGTPRIVGGLPARVGQFPYQVLIYYRIGTNNYMCGGSIISEQHILTAAHCLAGATNILVQAGNIDRNTQQNWIRSTVSEIFIHEEYIPEDPRGHQFPYNDIAVIRLRERYTLDGRVTAALRLRNTEVAVGVLCTVSGWGATKEGGSDSSILRFVSVPIVDRRVCALQLFKQILPGELCAGFSSGGRDSCAGDSGGPLVCSGLLTGVVSWGEGCARANRPGVYANVYWYREWIESKMAIFPRVNSTPIEGNSKSITTGPTSVIFVLNFILFLMYLIS